MITGRKTIGIAGLMGSGKSTAARLFGARGCKVIDADLEARAFMNHNKNLHSALVEIFGESIMAQGQLSFSALGSKVFQSRESLLQFNSIVHPPVVHFLQTLLETPTTSSVVLDAALIPLWGIEPWFATCIWIDSRFEVRLARLRAKHPEADDQKLIRRMQVQEDCMPPPINRSLWHNIDNNGSLDDLFSAIFPIIPQIH